MSKRKKQAPAAEIRTLEQAASGESTLAAEPATAAPTSFSGPQVIAILSLMVALAMPMLSFAYLFPLVENMPKWDQWSMIEVWSAHYEGRPVLPLLLKPYNGHLNLFPRFIFYGLGVVSHWNVRLEIIASYLFALGTLALLLRMLARQGVGMLMLAAPFSAQVFSFLQFENFLSGYAFGQVLSQFLSTLAIFLLTRPSVSSAAFIGAAAATAASTFSWGAGLAGWYVGLVALWVSPNRNRRRLTLWFVLTFLFTLAVKKGAGGSLGVIAWKQVPPFFFAVLGNAWTPEAFTDLSFAIRLGVASFLLFAALAVCLFIRFRREMLPWILLGLSTLASAGLIALGRAGAGPGQALASHYVTATYPLVLACIVFSCFLLLTATKRGRWVPLLHGFVFVLVLVPVLSAAAIGFRLVPVLRSWAATCRINSLEIVRGTASDKAIQTSHHPTPELVRWGVTVLRDHNLSWYRDAVDGYAPYGTVDLIADRRVDRSPLTVVVDNSWRVEGWAVRSRIRGGSVKAIRLFVDDRMIASARLDLPRHDVADQFGSASFLESGWLMTIPPNAVAEGAHRIRVEAFGYGGCHESLIDAEIVALHAAAIMQDPTSAPRAQAAH